jgi:GDPmannose 4,6-dehydratase
MTAIPSSASCKTALIRGISGQDGSYLARSLLRRGYKVYGASRDAELASFRHLEWLDIREQALPCL